MGAGPKRTTPLRPLGMGDRLKQFRVGQLLGKGAFGDVFKVTRLSDGQVYAMKKVSIASMSQKEVADTLNEIR
jgi:NIMA (never in mitosis gene a)-related kinase